MESKVVKQLSGHSGSVICLMDGPNGRYVRKIGNVRRNYERLSSLKGLVPLPEVLYYDNEVLDMEYIHGQDMRTYLLNNDPEPLLEFIIQTMTSFVDTKYSIGYTTMIFDGKVEGELESIAIDIRPELPQKYVITPYHGDFTLENIIYSEDRGFVLIDPVTTPYNSYVFDLAKLRQDLDCKWFLRNNPANIEPKLLYIRDKLSKKYWWFDNNALLISQLLRVYRHCKVGDSDYNFIVNEVKKRWKL